MQVVKMHGLGNDFIVIDNREKTIKNEAELAKRFCERRLNIGADGLVLVENSSVADVKMRIINADGSEAEMCGNGIRCFAKYCYENGIVQKKEMQVETLAGVMRPTIIEENNCVCAVTVDMGIPSFSPQEIPMDTKEKSLFQTISVLERPVSVGAVLMGVPHAIVIVDGVQVSWEDFASLGKEIEKHPVFPKHINVDFVEIESKNRIKMRTWERGAGPTLACGTGACAAVAVLSKGGMIEPEAEVSLYAGSLFIKVQERVFMTGPAEYVFFGEAE